MPDEVWNISERERNVRVQIDSDLCRLDDRYFIRGVAYIPVQGSDQCYGWGIWAEISQDNFFDYLESYKNDNSAKPRFDGWVANDIQYYANTLGLEVDVQLGDASQRPTFFFKASNHLLTQDQWKGISIEKVHSFSGKKL